MDFISRLPDFPLEENPALFMPATGNLQLNIELPDLKGALNMIKICLLGLGRAGSQIAKYLLASDRAEVVAGVCSPESPKSGRDLGEIVGSRETGVTVWPSDRLEECLFSAKPDVAIDFSRPDAALYSAKVLLSSGVRVVMGTTGFSMAEEAELYSLTDRFGGGLIYAPNVTRGISAMMLLSELAARILNGYDVEIIEINHKRKADIPSGTAAKLAGKLRESVPGPEIPVSSIRAGGTAGFHQVLLMGENDMVEISHQNFSLSAFAQGALDAAEFIHDKSGTFEMSDVMNFREILSEYLEEDETRSPRRLALV